LCVCVCVCVCERERERERREHRIHTRTPALAVAVARKVLRTGSFGGFARPLIVFVSLRYVHASEETKKPPKQGSNEPATVIPEVRTRVKIDVEKRLEPA